MKKEELIEDLKEVYLDNTYSSKKISEYAVEQCLEIYDIYIEDLLDHLQRLIGHSATLEKQKYAHTKEFNYSSDIVDAYEFLKKNHKEVLKFKLDKI